MIFPVSMKATVKSDMVAAMNVPRLFVCALGAILVGISGARAQSTGTAQPSTEITQPTSFPTQQGTAGTIPTGSGLGSYGSGSYGSGSYGAGRYGPGSYGPGADATRSQPVTGPQ
jgi:hypothetical protein